MKYVVIHEFGSKTGIYCMGIYDNFQLALGYAMESVFELRNDFDETAGAEFKISPLMDVEGDEDGCMFETTYKNSKSEKYTIDTYFILTHKEETS